MSQPKFYEMIARHVGRPRKFETPDDLWASCLEYIQWSEANPLEEDQLFAYQGEITRETVYHPRAMTIGAMCAFIGIDRQTWKNYREKEEFFAIATRVEEAMREQKFCGAAAGLLKENIIAREMGLTDKKQVENTHKFEKLSDEELERRLKALRDGTGE